MHVTDVGAENDTEKTIISAIKSNPYVSQEALAKLCNKSRITISRIIKKSNKIKRVGPDKGHFVYYSPKCYYLELVK